MRMTSRAGEAARSASSRALRSSPLLGTTLARCVSCRKEARKAKLRESAAKMKASQKTDSAFENSECGAGRASGWFTANVVAEGMSVGRDALPAL